MSFLALSGITKAYSGKKVLNDVDLEIDKGGIFALVGPNGAGKTTLLKIISGITKPDRGSVAFEGSRIGSLLQGSEPYPEMTCLSLLRFFYSLEGGDPSLRDEIVRERISACRIDDCNKKIRLLSNGEKKKVMIALAILNSPSIILMDEPLSGLDPKMKAAIRDLLAELSKKSTIIMSSHMLDDIERIASRVAMLNNGRIILSGPIEQVLEMDSVVTVKLRKATDEIVTRLLKSRHITSVETSGDTLIIHHDKSGVEKIIGLLKESGIIELSRGKSLERAFIEAS